MDGHGWLDEWMDKQMYEQTVGQMVGWMGMVKCMDTQIYELDTLDWMNRWMDGCTLRLLGY